MSIPTLDEAQERELYRLWRYYWKEARRCEEAKAYLAGIAMAAATLEAMLMLMVNAHPDVAEQTGKAPKRRNGSNRPLIDWNLGQLLAVAKAADWLPSGLNVATDEWSARRAKIGDYAEVCRMIRNLIHPGSYLTEHSPKRVTAKYLQRQFETVELCGDWLAERNAQGLRERMRGDESYEADGLH